MRYFRHYEKLNAVEDMVIECRRYNRKGKRWTVTLSHLDSSQSQRFGFLTAADARIHIDEMRAQA